MEEESIVYTKVSQMSQSEIIAPPKKIKPHVRKVAAVTKSIPGNVVIPHQQEESVFSSPLKWYYPQLAWGKLCSFLQPILGGHFSGNEVWPGVWISDIGSVCELAPLQDRNIRHVVCAVLGVKPMFPKNLQYTCLELRDTDDQDIYQYFDVIADLIHSETEAKKSILVHCRCGVSRSVTLVCAYLIKYQKMPALDAIRHIQESRPCANPIKPFRNQLKSYESNCRENDE